jgi:hypothetical protein
MKRLVILNGSPIDHIIVCGSDVDRMMEQFESFGLPTEYGGVHDNGITHNGVICFEDGSYVELLGMYDESQSPRREAFIKNDVGPCGWAIEAASIETEAESYAQRGVVTDAPFSMSRVGPSGEVAEWKVSFMGVDEPGQRLPFLIEDTTPRERRIRPTTTNSGTELVGISRVIIGVNDLDRAVAEFRRLFDVSLSSRSEDGIGSGREAAFEEGVSLVSFEDGPMADRVLRYGNIVSGFLVGTKDLRESLSRTDVAISERTAGGSRAWLSVENEVPGLLGYEVV